MKLETALVFVLIFWIITSADRNRFQDISASLPSLFVESDVLADKQPSVNRQGDDNAD